LDPVAVAPQHDPASEAAGRLYEEYRAPVYRYCLSRLRSPEEAEDAVQQAFMQAFRAYQRGFRPDVEAAWVFKIAHNVCLTRALSVKRRKRVESPSDFGELQDELAAPERQTPDEVAGLRDAMAEMPPRLRTVLLLREWRGLSYAEIAQELDTTVSAVETLVFRARRHVAQALGAPVRRAKRALDGLGIVQLVKALLAGGAAAKTATVVAATIGAAALLSTEGSRPAPADGVHVTPTSAARTPSTSPSLRDGPGRAEPAVTPEREAPERSSGPADRADPSADAPAPATGAAEAPPAGVADASVGISPPLAPVAPDVLPKAPLPVQPPALEQPPVAIPDLPAPPPVSTPEPPPVTVPTLPVDPPAVTVPTLPDPPAVTMPTLPVDPPALPEPPLPLP
jgi:RNA polymerase sigma-70 factor (ECF subfamily)